ncbi:MAG: pyridoxamine 5'-phosphate oxidase family protein [Microbacteriaceae bacterium]
MPPAPPPAETVRFPTAPADVPALDAASAPEHPLALLADWVAVAHDRGVLEPMYVTLATASAEGVPSSRTVQLLAVEPEALLFTTNLSSRKGVELAATGRAAVSLYWRETAQSVNVTGRVDYAMDEENDRRFAEEDRAVQAARVVSFHGLPLPDEAEQLQRFHALRDGAQAITRPTHWGWFRLRPDGVTFWEGRSGELNRRLHYRLDAGRWSRGAIQA